MEILFLGTGTSTGVPQIGCSCEVCSSKSSKDKRLRASVMISDENTNLLIDSGPDLRQQLLTYNVKHISALLLTHEHYDHVGGLDDIRPLGDLNVYAEKRVVDAVHRVMPYCFGENKYPGVPLIRMNEIDESSFLQVGNLSIHPIRLMHASLPILGYRINNIAYLTDVKTIDDKSLEKLQNLDVLVIDTLQQKEHMSHLSLREALLVSDKIGASKTYLIHMGHRIGLHDQTQKSLPEHVYLSYDGLKVSL